MMKAKVMEEKRVKRPRLYLTLEKAGPDEGGYWNVNRVCEEPVPPSKLYWQFTIPGEDDVLTEEKVREIAEHIYKCGAWTNHSNTIEGLMAFAKELGVIE